MSTDALELALALNQAPIQRFALQARPLPANLDEVLQLASAMQPQLRTAAARCSESEETVVEAVRFYLHQVLFESGTDAYRILGLTPDADSKKIRQHHIWLQRWLHPDRRGEDWEAELATKVNWAWRQLRNESSRKKYDESREDSLAQSALVPTSIAGMVDIEMPAWNGRSVDLGRYWLRRSVMAGLLAACAGLFYLAATRQDPVDSDLFAAQTRSTGSEIVPGFSSHEESGLRAQQPPQQNTAEKITDEPASSHGDAIVLKASETARAGGLTHTSSPVAIPDDKPSPFADKSLKPAGTPSVPAADVSRVAPAPADALAPARQSVLTANVPPPGSKLDLDAATPHQYRHATTSDLDERSHAPARVAEPARAEPATDIALNNVRIEPALSPSESPSEKGVEVVAATETGRQSKTEEARLPSTVEEGAGVSRAVPEREIQETVLNALASTAIQPTASAEPTDVFPAAPMSPQQSATLPNSAATELLPSAERETATVVRFELARARVRKLVSYFGSAEATSPHWNEEWDGQTVERQRGILYERSGEREIERFVLDPPVWNISHAAVSLSAMYHTRTKLTSIESGRLRLEMVWNVDNWKITRLELSPES